MLAVVLVLAAAISTCAPRHIVVDALKQRYNEHLVWIGFINDGLRTEMFVSEHGSYTILHTSKGAAGEMSCIISSGKGWNIRKLKRGKLL